jgi:signal transduction histidine kinase
VQGQSGASDSGVPHQTGVLSGLGVRARLSLAFFAVCAFGVLGAAAAFYSFREFDDALGLITQQRTPAALKSQELARHAERIVDAAPALLTVANQSEKNKRTDEITGDEGALYERLADLKDAGVDRAVLEGLEADVKRLNGNLTALDTLVNNRLRIGERKRQVLSDAVQAAAAVQQLLVPWSAVMEQAIAQWRRSKLDYTLPLARRGEADAEFERSLAWFQALQASQVAASNVSDLLQRASAADTESGVRVAGFRLQQALNELERLSGDFDPRLRTLLVEALAKLRPFAVGDASVPALRLREIALIAEGSKLLSENAALSKGLAAKVADLTAAASRDITEANSKATSVLQFSTWVLVAAVILSLVSSLLIGWLYVGRNVVARLTTLSDGMRAIVGGQRDIAIPSGGGDEIAEMARAVEVFRDNAIALDQLLADQELAAVRLEQKVEQRTHELSQSVSELRALGEVTQAVTSTLELQTVLTTIVAKATQLSGTEAGAIYVFDEASGEFQLRATYGTSEELIATLRDRHSALSSAVGGLAEYRAPVQTADLRNEPPSLVNDIIVKAGYRARLLVPLIHSGETVGALVVRRRQPGEFPRQTVDLLQTFAAQSALAIQNARLYSELETARDATVLREQKLEQRTVELSKSLDDLNIAQDRLVQTQKLASLGQLTAGIAHEIKNPLNFVNNFSSVSVELIDELLDTLKGTPLEAKARTEISGVTGILRDNLGKIVQHGKRADSIVKNMLLHARAGSGDHRPADINAIVEESLNLAYHGARAERQGFNITLEKALDPAAGEIDLFPQEITRVFLNLISNGFYAATKRKMDGNGGGAYQPTLLAATRNLGDRVEIRIRDNGIGIPDDVRNQMFNPFFTTKPAGEGTGLGLSLSHDIIVKQHAGTIEVDTRAGEFTEFRITLPRKAASLGQGA